MGAFLEGGGCCRDAPPRRPLTSTTSSSSSPSSSSSSPSSSSSSFFLLEEPFLAGAAFAFLPDAFLLGVALVLRPLLAVVLAGTAAPLVLREEGAAFLPGDSLEVDRFGGSSFFPLVGDLPFPTGFIFVCAVPLRPWPASSDSLAFREGLAFFFAPRFGSIFLAPSFREGQGYLLSNSPRPHPPQHASTGPPEPKNGVPVRFRFSSVGFAWRGGWGWISSYEGQGEEDETLRYPPGEEGPRKSIEA